MYPWLFNVYMDAVRKEVQMEMGSIGVKFLYEGREGRLPGLLYADDLVIFGVFFCKPEQDMKVMMERFVGVCRRIDMKTNANKSKVMSARWRGEIGGRIHVGDRARLKHVSEFIFGVCFGGVRYRCCLVT